MTIHHVLCPDCGSASFTRRITTPHLLSCNNCQLAYTESEGRSAAAEGRKMKGRGWNLKPKKKDRRAPGSGQIAGPAYRRGYRWGAA